MLYFKESTETCSFEKFQAKCENNDVIMMTHANYGRMKVGRCIRRNYGKYRFLHCVAKCTTYLMYEFNSDMCFTKRVKGQKVF